MKALVLLMFIVSTNPLFSQIVINEVLSGNVLGYQDSPGAYPDWIELKNTSSTAVNLSGYFLSNKANVPNKWSIPSGTIIPGNGYLLFIADEANTGLHTNFKLSSSKEEIILSDPSINRVDSIGYQKLPNNISFGKINTNDHSYLNTPTPNSANNLGSAFEYSDYVVSISVPTGIYTTVQNIAITTSDTGSIYYTLDGTTPTSSSNLYTSPLVINSNTILKAIVFETPTKYSLVENRSYVFGVTHDLPIVMLTSDNLFYDSYNHEEIDGRVEFTFIETDGNTKINQYANFKQSGLTSNYYPPLNGKIDANALYGDKDFDHKMYPHKEIDAFNSFLLRNASQDWANTHIRDAFVSRLIGKDNLTNTPFESYRPAVLYVNAQYRGITNIREDNDNDYVKHNFNLKGSEFLGNVFYQGAFVDFSTLDFTSAADRLAFEQRVDFHEHLSMRLVFSYAYPSEWGWTIWEDLSGKTGTQYHYNFHDFDPIYGLAFDGANFSTTTTAPMSVSFLMENSIKNYPPYLNEAVQYICANINHVYNTPRSMAILDDMEAELLSEIPAHAVAMNTLVDSSNIAFNLNQRPFSSLTQWQNNITDLRTNIATTMDDSIFVRIKQAYLLGDTMLVTYESSNINQGFIRVHTVKSVDEVFTGAYFENIPIRFSAEALPGYRFVDWDGDVISTNEAINPTFSGSASIRANFEPIPTGSTALVINEVQAKNDTTIADNNGEFDDWIEIHNPTSSAINLSGYYISDNSNDTLKWKIPDSNPSKTTVPAHGFILLWADNDTIQGADHLNFKLNETETIRLTSPDANTLVQELTIQPVGTDNSYGAQVDADPNYILFNIPTPDSSNNSLFANLEVPHLSSIIVYPNPTKNSITIANLPTSSKSLNWKLFNVNGQLMKTGNSTEIDLELLDNGVYTLRIFEVDFVKILKL